MGTPSILFLVVLELGSIAGYDAKSRLTTIFPDPFLGLPERHAQNLKMWECLKWPTRRFDPKLNYSSKEPQSSYFYRFLFHLSPEKTNP